MPLSDRRFNKDVEDFLAAHPGESYLDIGAGVGKYGKMIKKLFPKSQVIGIESWLGYIEKYELEKVYDSVLNIPIEQFIKQNPRFTCDIAVAGDLLEHLFKSDGLDLLHFLVYRTKYIVVIFPSKFVQYDLKGVAEEAHNSVWDETDFKQFKHQYIKKDFMNMVIIEGYLQDSEAIISREK